MAASGASVAAALFGSSGGAGAGAAGLSPRAATPGSALRSSSVIEGRPPWKYTYRGEDELPVTTSARKPKPASP